MQRSYPKFSGLSEGHRTEKLERRGQATEPSKLEVPTTNHTSSSVLRLKPLSVRQFNHKNQKLPLLGRSLTFFSIFFSGSSFTDFNCFLTVFFVTRFGSRRPESTLTDFRSTVHEGLARIELCPALDQPVLANL